MGLKAAEVVEKESLRFSLLILTPWILVNLPLLNRMVLVRLKCIDNVPLKSEMGSYTCSFSKKHVYALLQL